MEPVPIMAWTSSEPIDVDGRIVWWSRLDGRYQVEVQRLDDRNAYLCIFDHANENQLIHRENVGLAYGARFGADAIDVGEWQSRAIEVIDSQRL